MNVRARFFLPSAIALVALGAACLSVETGTGSATDTGTGLWPQIEPFDSGYLRVSDIHEIYYEQSGNPEGKPVFVLHGGPGGRSSPYMRRFFNPDRFRIILHDQRGAGRSTPYLETRENTTWHLVEDIERLRQHLGIEKLVLFGGSWGSTLALAYAETHPDRVDGMVLRGTFTATQEEIDHFYHGGVSLFFPDVYERLLAALPEPDRRPLPDYLLELIQTDDPVARKRYSAAWFRYEVKLSQLEVPDEQVDAFLEQYDPVPLALLENHYMANGCFFEEGQLLRNAGKIREIPTIFVNGRYDVICPTRTAYRLSRMLPKSKLVVAESSGHWMGDPKLQEALLEAVREFE